MEDHVPIQKVNPITAHGLVLMPPTKQQDKPFGWIVLLNGNKFGGFIYLRTPFTPSDPFLSSDGSYVVTAMPMESLDTMLNILQNEKNLQIRYFDPQAAGTSPSVFIEPAAAAQSTGNNPFNVPDELAAEIAKRLKG
jgi:hypothetical protein